MSQEEATLIETVEKFPHLWDKSDLYYKDKIAIENSWQTVAHIMSLPVEECKEMWKYLRLKFIRERNLCKNIPSGSGAYSCKWPLYAKLGFLQGAINTRRTKGNISKRNVPSTSSELWDDLLLDEDEEVPCREEERLQEAEPERETFRSVNRHKRILSDISNSPSECETPKRKRPSAVPIDELVETCSSVGKSLSDFLQSSSGTNFPKEDFHFGLSVVESISKIKNEKTKVQTKAKIFQIIAEAMD